MFRSQAPAEAGDNGLFRLGVAVETDQPHHGVRLTPALKAELLRLAVEQPGWASRRLAEEIGSTVSHVTVSKVLARHNLADSFKRAWRLQNLYRGRENELSEEQLRAIAKVNPCIRDLADPSPAPGRRLIQTVLSGRRQFVIDAYSMTIFFWNPQSLQRDPIDLLDKKVLPFFSSVGLPVHEIRTNRATLYGATTKHPYRKYLAEREIHHLRLPKGEIFQQSSLKRFQLLYGDKAWTRGQTLTVDEDGQAGVDAWCLSFNMERLHGYPHYGRTPWQMLTEYVSQHG